MFDLILQEAVNKILKPEQMIKKVLVVTHDDFNTKDWLATYEEIGRKFEKNGYDDVVPQLVYWALLAAGICNPMVPSRLPGGAHCE